MSISLRLARLDDAPELETLIARSARGLRTGFYSEEQVEAALGGVFGVDRQLIRDGTYLVAVEAGGIVGCGGWSKRWTPYGGDGAASRDGSLRDPAHDPAILRAFFVHPEHARRGIGRALMRACEAAAVAAGFRSIDVVATLPGEPLYAAAGYRVVGRSEIALASGVRLPVVEMSREVELTARSA